MDQTEHDSLSQEFLMHEDTSSMEGTDTEQSCSNEETVKDSECAYDVECTSRQEQNATRSLRQRKIDKQSPVVRMQLALSLLNTSRTIKPLVILVKGCFWELFFLHSGLLSEGIWHFKK